METKEYKIDQKKLDRLFKDILRLEDKNIQTSEFSDAKIIDKIKKLIEGEVKC